MSWLPRWRWTWRRRLLFTYLLLLVLHHVWSALPKAPAPLAPGEKVMEIGAVEGTESAAGVPVRMTYFDAGPPTASALVLLHGSPGSAHDFDRLAARLGPDLRVVRPDLPGFAHSTRAVPDYSFLAYAVYVDSMLTRLGIERAHVVGFSMGGAVALELQRMDPDRVASIVMLSGLGVQEFELLGNYEINHALHGAQLAAIWALTRLVPHFGVLDGFLFGLPYARNFYDSDQRPLREVLERYDGPMLVIHGRDDFLVPFEAAQEHLRIVPQARARIFDEGSHFLVWTHAGEVARELEDWVARVDAGEELGRADADPQRVEAASQPLEATRDRRATGFTRFLLLVLLVLGTFVTEDVTSIAGGLLIAQGRLTWVEGLGAVFFGIYFGDLLLYFAGRVLGRRVLRRAPLRWMLDEADLERGARWFARRGFLAILLSRFVPGTRLPTYVAAGVVRAGFVRFALYFLVAVAIWTPLLVGFAAVVGQEAMERIEHFRQDSLWVFALLVLLLAGVVRVLVPLVRWRGRRLALSRWRRLTRWEYWPAWALYAPVAWRVLRIARNHGGLWAPTAVNPGMPASGIVGESKSGILAAFGDDPRVARFEALGRELDTRERRRRVERFLDRHGLDLPIVVKPDAGQRGEGVVIVRDLPTLDRVVEGPPIDLVLQEFVPGEEYGVFYAREHEDRPGRIISLTQKVPLVIFGDGRSTLERLILSDDRAIDLAPIHLARHEVQLDRVLASGERFVVAELGTHARGSTFVDASEAITVELETAIDQLSRRFEGFRFGRYDLRVPSRDALRRGEGFQVIELNGLTSESTHVYDARYRYRDAVRVLRAQWELAYRIGADQIARGHAVTGPRAIFRLWWEHRRRRRFLAADRVIPAVEADVR